MRTAPLLALATLALPAALRADAPTTAHADMVWIAPTTFDMGADAADREARADERPVHRVRVDGFWIDATEVTNAEFKRFVDATGYVTTAERKPDWEEMKKQLPPGTPKPPEEVLVPGSLVFQSVTAEQMRAGAHWWDWRAGASWRHPEGPQSSIDGRMNFPVVQASWDDAVAYAKWAGKRLPTEAEWECAARAGGKPGEAFTWGDEPIESGKPKANTWQGRFPTNDTKWDGFGGAAPVKSFPPSPAGLYDMAGNVWEWTSDWYRPDAYAKDAAKGEVADPAGPADSLDPDEPTIPKRVVRGGSFLCNASYCSSYRVSARMKTSPDTGLSHTGFRCVRSGRVTATTRPSDRDAK